MKIKRLLEPVKDCRCSYLISFFSLAIIELKPIIFVQILALIVHAISEGDTWKLYTYVGIFLAFSLFVYWAYFMREISADSFWTKLSYSLTKKIGKSYLEIDNVLVEKMGIGRVSSIISHAIHSRQHLLRRGLHLMVIYFISLVYSLVLIYQYLSLGYFLIIFCFVLLSFGAIALSFVFRKQYYTDFSENITRFDRQIMKVLMSKFEIIQNNNYPLEAKKINLLMKNFSRIFARWRIRRTWFLLLSSGSLEVLRIACFFVFWVGVISGNYDLAFFILLVELIRIMISSLHDLFLAIAQDYLNNMIHIEKLWEFLDSVKKKDYEAGLPFSYQKGELVVENISFVYEEGKSVFENFSCLLQAGKKTALVGPSGGGKTTLVKLLAGYIYPDQGAVLVDGQDLAEVKLSEYYRHIGYLSQEPNVFDGTIKENLLYGLSDEQQQDKTVLKKRIEEVISSSRCEFVYEMKKGLNTEIGERGVRLSWGQKQRLAIAKIMLKDPQIVFLDEPTSALDSISEQAISEALNNLFIGKTVVVVAHRLQTVRNADEILFIQEGEIKERGTHQELKRGKGKYAEMLELQTSF